MAVYNDTIQARFEALTGGAEKGLEGLMVKLGLIESRAIRANKQLRSLMGSGRTQQGSMFGAMMNVDARDMPGYKLSESLALADKAAIASSKEMDNFYNSLFPRTPAGFKELDDMFPNLNKKMSIFADQGRSIGILMGLIFGGMTFQRWGQSLLRFVLPSMEKLNGYTSEGTKRVMAMNASFEFLKFQMFEAFTQTGLFKIFVDLVIKLSNWLAEIAAQYPGITNVVAILGATLAAGGWVMQILGGFFQAGMFWHLLFNKDTSSDSLSALDKIKNKMADMDLSKALGVGLSVGVVALSAVDAITNINKGDFAGALANGVSAALGIAGAAAFLLGSGPLGWILTITGAIVLAATKITADTRQATQSANEALGIKENPFVTLIDSFAGVDKSGRINSAFNKVSYEFSQGYSQLLDLQEEFSSTSVKNAEKRVSLNKQIASLEKSLQDDKNALLALDAEKGALIIQDIQFQIDAQKEAAGSIDETATAYTPLISNIAASKEETSDFITNTQKMIDLINGETFMQAVGKLFLVDTAFILANMHFRGFAKELDEWAKKVVTKTVVVEYKTKNKPSDLDSPSTQKYTNANGRISGT